MALGAALAIFAGGLTRWAIEITVIDDAVTRRIVQAPVPGLTGIARVIAEAGAAPAIVGYVSRARLQQELALRSGGRLRLDPSP